jgi:hypothetical protein
MTKSKPVGRSVAAMTTIHEGGCLCGNVRYITIAEPVRVTICHCTFCQKLTGSAFLVEPIFRKEDVALSGFTTKSYDHLSDTSGKRVTLNFCGTCGTTIYLELERFPDVLGLCAGTFDNPNWFDRRSKATRHIFARSAQDGVLLPAGVNIFVEHALQLDGTPNQPTVLEEPVMISSKGERS